MCSMFIGTTIFLFYTACLIIPSNKARTNALLIITPPSSSNDFRQLASLLASSFDAPAPARTTTSTSKATVEPAAAAAAAAAGKQQNATNGKSYIETLKLNVEWFYWNLVEKALTEQYTYNQYVSTVQKMRGKKYALFVAKEEEYSMNHYPMIVTKKEATSDSLSFAGKGDVVGMIEMGMTVYPPMMNEPRRRRRTTTRRNDDEQEQKSRQQIEKDKETEQEEEKSHRNNDSGCQKLYNTTLLPTNKQPPQLVPTIGVICVKSTHQREGIGKSLVEKCKYVAKHVWNETCLFADVEPSNVGALRFLVDSCGFRVMPTNDDENCYGRGRVMMRNATVSRRRRMESRPHIALYSRLDDDDDIMDGLYVTRGEE